MLTDARIDCGLKHRLITQSSQAILLGYSLVKLNQASFYALLFG